MKLRAVAFLPLELSTSKNYFRFNYIIIAKIIKLLKTSKKFINKGLD